MRCYLRWAIPVFWEYGRALHWLYRAAANISLLSVFATHMPAWTVLVERCALLPPYLPPLHLSRHLTYLCLWLGRLVGRLPAAVFLRHTGMRVVVRLV
jgi:hypothetical protein